jgi:hypothetical protein
LLSCATAHAVALIPMDLTQTDHLKSYGVAYWALEKGYRVEWLLNYRSGSFLILDGLDDVRSECRYRGVAWEEPDGATLAQVYRQIEEENMELVLLEQAPAIALYAPDNTQPWDDAVMLALEYAEIPYTVIWDAEVQAGGLETYDWLHLHHEDFTGQYGKFHASFRNADWYKEQKTYYERLAREQGFPSVSEHKKATAREIREYVRRGGFLFAMCSATDSFDIALAAAGVDIVDTPFDGTPPEPGYQVKLDFARSLAFTDFRLIPSPNVYEFSDIDMTEVAVLRPEEIDYFTLFEFAAKHDPVRSRGSWARPPATGAAWSRSTLPCWATTRARTRSSTSTAIWDAAPSPSWVAMTPRTTAIWWVTRRRSSPYIRTPPAIA